jgi:hypothetical protein
MLFVEAGGHDLFVQGNLIGRIVMMQWASLLVCEVLHDSPPHKKIEEGEASNV